MTGGAHDTLRDEILAAAERISDLLTMLGVDPDEVPEHGGETTATVIARAAVDAARIARGQP
jgi:hypothetical protein